MKRNKTQSPPRTSSSSSRQRVTTRSGWPFAMVAASLALAGTACEAPIEADALADELDELDETLRSSSSLTDEDLHPVLLTSGTCVSKGFRPIETAEACTLADAMLLDTATVSGPIASAGGGGIPRGCSITAESTGSGDFELRTNFVDGSAEQLEGQTCSHDAPCVCADDLAADGADSDPDADPDASDGSNQPGHVCQDGEFRPDPNKYYAIRSPNGRYIRATGIGPSIFLTPIEGDATDPYTQPYISIAGFDLDNDPSVTRLQWRFEAVGDEFSPINRETGMRLVSGTTGALTLGSGQTPSPSTRTVLLGTNSESEPPFSFECRGSQVFFEQDGFSPVDAGGLLEDVSGVRAISFPLVYTEPQSPGFIRAKSGCVKKSRSCTSMYGDGFEQTGRKLCGFLNRNHQLTCENVLEAPASMHVPQGWYVEEVTEYSRAVDFDPAPVRVDPLASPAAVADSLASFGASSAGSIGAASVVVATNRLIAAGSGPLYGALFSVGFNAIFEFGPLVGLDVFEQPDPVAELADALPGILQKLADDIDARTEVLISNGLTQESARELSARLNERRRLFYLEYPILRETRLGLNDPLETLRLVDDILEDAEDLGVDINTTLPTLGDNASEDDVRRAHFSLDVAKLATVEAMIMLSEGILLEADSLPSLTCEEIVADRSLQVRADLFKEKLEGAVEELVAFGLASRSNRINSSAEEFEHDARNFSYPIGRQLEFLDSIVEETTEKCLRLRDPEDSFRENFRANTPVVE